MLLQLSPEKLWSMNAMTVEYLVKTSSPLLSVLFVLSFQEIYQFLAVLQVTLYASHVEEECCIVQPAEDSWAIIQVVWLLH